MPPRDWHLRTKDFLEVKTHPEIRVTAERVERLPEGQLVVTALFELHGQRQPVELRAHLHDGPAPVLHLQGVLDRHDFGIRARQPFEMIVGSEIHLDVELALERPG
jgi:polyisoprenoid-binding protein YceI